MPADDCRNRRLMLPKPILSAAARCSRPSGEPPESPSSLSDRRRRPLHVPAKGKLIVPALDDGLRLGARCLVRGVARSVRRACLHAPLRAVNGGQDRYRIRRRVSRLSGLTVGVVLDRGLSTVLSKQSN